MTSQNKRTSIMDQDQSHSSDSARRSADYHSKNVDPNVVRRSEMKMTRTESRRQSLQDVDESGVNA
jgi:hypothetical protein